MYRGSLAPFSNREDWQITGTLVDEDGDDVTLTGSTIAFYLTKPGNPTTAELTGSTTDGEITLPTTTSFQIDFTPDDVSDLAAGTYDAYLRVTIDDVVTQVIAGTMEVVEGGPE